MKKYNENTSMEPRLLEALREQLDELNGAHDLASQLPHQRWIEGAICAYEALTCDYQWQLAKEEVSGMTIYYIANEDFTELILPSICSFFLN